MTVLINMSFKCPLACMWLAGDSYSACSWHGPINMSKRLRAVRNASRVADKIVWREIYYSVSEGNMPAMLYGAETK